MATRSGAGKAGVANSSKTSASKAATVRSRSQSRSDGTDGSRPTLSSKAVRTAPSTVGQKGTRSGLKSAAARKSTAGYSAPGHSGGYRQESAPKLGRTSAISGGTSTNYGTAAARNNSQAGASGAVSGKSTTYGQAPAKNVNKGAYGTWEGK